MCVFKNQGLFGRLSVGLYIHLMVIWNAQGQKCDPHSSLFFNLMNQTWNSSWRTCTKVSLCSVIISVFHSYCNLSVIQSTVVHSNLFKLVGRNVDKCGVEATKILRTRLRQWLKYLDFSLGLSHFWPGLLNHTPVSNSSVLTSKPSNLISQSSWEPLVCLVRCDIDD